MRRTLPCLGLLLLVAPVLPLRAAPAEPAEATSTPAGVAGLPDRYIVVLNEGAARKAREKTSRPPIEEVAADLAENYGGSVERSWDAALLGFQIRIGEAGARALAADPRVKRVRQDRQILALRDLPMSCYGYDSQSAPAPAERRLGERATQSITCDDPDPRNPARDCTDNWGLDRIDQTDAARDGVYSYTATGAGVDVYVLDSGIRADHQDFEVVGSPVLATRVTAGYNAILGGTSTTDCHGHGTHVAGIIGGNRSGVAKGVLLHPVKFLDRCPDEPEGGGVSDVVSGLEWILEHHDVATDGPAVVNWSGGNGSALLGDDPQATNPDVQEAVANLLAAGIAFVESAGNQSNDINGQPTDACQRSLGGVPGLDAVLVVGATDSNQSETPIDGRWVRELADPSYNHLCSVALKDCGSNWGTCIDLWAPGAHIISADADDPTGYCRLSGTSMAATHVTGAVALYLESHPEATPAEVQQALVDGATCGVLETDPASPYAIGAGSPNLLLHAHLAGGGPAPCAGSPDSLAAVLAAVVRLLLLESAP